MAETYLLCRRLGSTRAGAVAGGLVFGGTFGFQNVYLPPFLEGGAWLPIAALALTCAAMLIAFGYFGMLPTPEVNTVSRSIFMAFGVASATLYAGVPYTFTISA